MPKLWAVYSERLGQGYNVTFALFIKEDFPELRTMDLLGGKPATKPLNQQKNLKKPLNQACYNKFYHDASFSIVSYHHKNTKLHKIFIIGNTPILLLILAKYKRIFHTDKGNCY